MKKIMPANLLIFDADYVSELTANMNMACGLLAEAVSSLKSASNHENWKCKERTKIIEGFDELNLKLSRLDKGVNETTKVLGKSVSRFADLENKYDVQANSLSEELTSNHGFSATVHTEGSQSVEGNSAGKASARAAAGASGASGAAAVAGASGATSAKAELRTEKPSSEGKEAVNSAGTPGKAGMSGGAAGVRINLGSNMLNQKTNENKTMNSDTSGGTGTLSVAGAGGVIMNVNLPVTHIPDNPSAAAKGTKDTKEIASAALNSVVGTMTEALSSENSTDLEGIASRLSETYNAGRSVFESSAAIIATPTQPHTSERLAMAAGLVTLAQDSGSVSSSSSSNSGNFSQNAVMISSALEGNDDASELRSLLTMMTGQGDESGSVSSSGGDDRSFLDVIMEELKKIFFGDQEEGGVSSSSYSENSLESSSPVMKFLDNFVMDEAV